MLNTSPHGSDSVFHYSTWKQDNESNQGPSNCGITIQRQMGKAGQAVASLFNMEHSENLYTLWQSFPVPGPGALSIKWEGVQAAFQFIFYSYRGHLPLIFTLTLTLINSGTVQNTGHIIFTLFLSFRDIFINFESWTIF